jgi:hypothetical protein
MRAAGEKKFSIVEWVVIFGLGATAVAITQFVAINQNWQDAIVYTVVLFTVVILALRPAWGRKAFWRNLTLIFVLHILAILVIEQSLPAGKRGLHGLPLTLIGMMEALLIAGALWKRSMRSKSDPS